MNFSSSSSAWASSALCLLLVLPAWALNPGDLAVMMNIPMAKGGRWLWNSRVVLPEGQEALTVFKDQDILGICQQAYDDMVTDSTKPRLMEYKTQNNFAGTVKVPTAMTVMAAGDSVYMMSSMRGDGFLYTTDGTISDEAQPVVSQALERCQCQSLGSRIHRTDAKCGEPLSAHAFFKDHSGATMQDIAHAKVVTCGRNRRTKDLFVLVPCGAEPGQAEDVWGCQAFVTDLSLQAIDKDTTPTDPSAISLPQGSTVKQPCLSASN